MGEYTSNKWFYLPDLGAHGETEKQKYDDAQEAVDVEIQSQRDRLDSHASRHESGGSDELNLTGLSGDLADAQEPTNHGKSYHDSTVLDVDDLAANGGSVPEVDRINNFTGGDQQQNGNDMLDTSDLAANGGSVPEVDRINNFTGGDQQQNGNDMLDTSDLAANGGSVITNEGSGGYTMSIDTNGIPYLQEV